MADLLKLNQLSISSGHEISLALPEGKLGLLLGDEGAGRGALLRQISGIQPMASGEIFLKGDLIARNGKSPQPWERDIELVFRYGAFYPHLNGVENILFALQRYTLRAKRRTVLKLLSEMGLLELASQYPAQLNSDELLFLRIARALVTRPALLLIEEPFLDLKAEARRELLDHLQRWAYELKFGLLITTAIRGEMLFAGDFAGVMGGGKLLQWGRPQQLYLTPRERAVAHYMGEGVLVRCVVHDEKRLDTELGMVDHPQGFGLPVGTKLELLIRPEDLLFDEKSRRRARVLERSAHGPRSLCRLQLTPDIELYRAFPNYLDERISGELRYQLKIRSMVLFKRDPDERT